MPVLNQLPHMPEEEGQQQYLNVRTVDVGVRHDDDFAVAELCDVELVADTASERLNQRDNLHRGIDAVKPRLFYVEYLSAQRKYRLEPAVSAVLRRTARRVALDDVEFG